MHTSYLLVGDGFEAARQLPQNAAPECRQLHGHSFRVVARANSAHTDYTTLATALTYALAPLHYHSLNDVFAQPDDVAIAMHLVNQLPPPASLWLRSAPQQGALVEQGHNTLIWLEGEFEAAHLLPNVPVGHKCRRLHGHCFVIRLYADAQQISLLDLKAAWALQQQRLHHHYLNDIDGLSNPTSEVIAAWLFHQISASIGLAWVEVHETPTAGSQFDGSTFRIWKEQRFESAVTLHHTGRYTGHSYLVRLMLSATLDNTMGWVLDFDDVKKRFKPFYHQLDHNLVSQLISIRHDHSSAIAQWIHSNLSPLVPELSRVDLIENTQRGVSLTFYPTMHWPLMME